MNPLTVLQRVIIDEAHWTDSVLQELTEERDTGIASTYNERAAERAPVTTLGLDNRVAQKARGQSGRAGPKSDKH